MFWMSLKRRQSFAENRREEMHDPVLAMRDLKQRKDLGSWKSTFSSKQNSSESHLILSFNAFGNFKL